MRLKAINSRKGEGSPVAAPLIGISKKQARLLREEAMYINWEDLTLRFDPVLNRPGFVGGHLV